MSLLESCETLYGTRDLYKILSVDHLVKSSELKKAYYKLSLEVHPDRVEENEKEIATKKFQVLAKVYSILSDKEKRIVYDETGEIDEENLNSENKDWDHYWRLIFKKISSADIENFEKKYKGSDEELNDLKQAYLDGEGDRDYIIQNVLCTSIEDEDRFEKIISKWISEKKVKSFKKFTSDSKKQKDARKRKASKEEREAEDLKKQLGLDENDSSLQELILKRNQDRGAAMDSFFDSLAAKYGAKKEQKKKSKSN